MCGGEIYVQVTALRKLQQGERNDNVFSEISFQFSVHRKVTRTVSKR